jgi:RNA polymerase sigma-70 factor (ECF subfamily)
VVKRISRSDLRHRAGLDRVADEELMALAAAGDPDAFEVVLARHSDAAFSLAYRMCGRRVLAEEVTQEGFLTVWRTAGRYDPTRGSVRTWTLSIVRNRAIDTLRANGRSVQVLGGAESEPEQLGARAAEETDVAAIANVRAHAIQRCLAELPDEQRQAIELAYYGGFTQSEIAAMLGEPLGTIKGRMRLGLLRLRGTASGWRAAA